MSTLALTKGRFPMFSLRQWAGVGALLVALLTASKAHAQETKGAILGHVTDMANGQPLSGLTVILQGPQGEDATLTDDAGNYTFPDLSVGTYTVRFYSANASTNIDRSDLKVSAGATLRADAAMPSAGMAQETYVIKTKAAAVDVGSARLGATFNEEYINNVPVERTFGDLMLKAPGAFLESSGSVSVAGASGLENVYVMDGLNVTGMDLGDIMNRRSDANGGSNLTLEFVKEMQLNTGGYRAEYGGAMGGVVNVITKSGTNEMKGSASLHWAPYWLSGNPRSIVRAQSSLDGVDKPDYDTNVAVEVGGPIIKDRLFFWLGFAPRLEKSHFFRDAYAFSDDGNGQIALDPAGNPERTLLMRTRTRELRQSYQYGGKIDFNVAPEHHLTIGLFGTPTFSRHVRSWAGAEAVGDPGWALQGLKKNNTDFTANWTSQLFDNHWRIDATLGLHREDSSDKSPNSALNGINQMQWHEGHLSDFENIPVCAIQANGFDPCPVTDYRNGGYGLVKDYTGNRWVADVKSTHLIKYNEFKIGAHTELNTLDQTRYYSGPAGHRNFLWNGGGATYAWNFFSLQPGQYPGQFADDDLKNGTLDQLAADPYYKDQLSASVKSLNTSYFIQDSVHPVQNLTVDLGVRLDNQRMYDFRGDRFLNLMNLGPRLGVVFDPSNQGRSKIFAHYGKFYETIPMNLAARYFGGEGILLKVQDNTMCSQPPSTWTGKGGEADTCQNLGYIPYNGGSSYPVQPSIKGQSHHEIVAGLQQALTDDLVVGVDFTHRWLATIIEDGTIDGANFVLANPGQIPDGALNEMRDRIEAKKAEIVANTDSTKTAALASDLGALQAVAANLKGLADQPKPERTYDALTLSASKRLAHNWMLRASYTYSRLIGNYNGLYDVDNNYAAPNGNNAYDYPVLVLNKNGPLANDRPHSGHVDGFYQVPVGKGVMTFGASFLAYSGIPRNYVAAVSPGQQLVFLLPRGSAGRTPTITQTDVKIAYRQDLSKTLAVEAFFDIYNLMNQRTALAVDDNYTYDTAAAIVNGNVNDLKFARNSSGAPLTKNPNFGQPTAYQSPIYGRMGLRVLF